MPVHCSKEDLAADAIENTVTAKDVKLVAQRVTRDIAVKVLDYHLNPYSTDKIGFMGSHRKLTLIVKKSSESDSESIHLFVKSIPYECTSQADFIKKGNVFVKEEAFYRKVVPWITEDYKSEKWAPTCYLTKDDTMIMEDLGYQGYTMLNNIIDDLEILSSGITTLARFHSCSILTEARLKQQSKDFQLNDYCPESFKEGMFDRASKAFYWYSAGIEVAATVAEHLGYDSQKLRISADRVYGLVKPSKIYPNVISHGDLWKNNLMFDNSSPRKCVLVDFQVVRYAPKVLDILMFLYINATRECRKKSESDLVKLYYLVMLETLKSNDPNGLASIPTLQEIRTEIEDFRIFGPIIATISLPIFLLDSKTAKKSTEDPEKFERFMFGDRRDTVLAYMQENEFYKKMIEDNVIEFIEVCERLDN